MNTQENSIRFKKMQYTKCLVLAEACRLRIWVHLYFILQLLDIKVDLGDQNLVLEMLSGLKCGESKRYGAQRAQRYNP